MGVAFKRVTRQLDDGPNDATASSSASGVLSGERISLQLDDGPNDATASSSASNALSGGGLAGARLWVQRSGS